MRYGARRSCLCSVGFPPCISCRLCFSTSIQYVLFYGMRIYIKKRVSCTVSCLLSSSRGILVGVDVSCETRGAMRVSRFICMGLVDAAVHVYILYVRPVPVLCMRIQNAAFFLLPIPRTHKTLIPTNDNPENSYKPFETQ